MHDSDALTGLMAPPFTPFLPSGELALHVVDRLAEYFAATGVRGVFVAGTTGEGMSLSDAERRLLAERWVTAGKAADLHVIIQVGCTSLTATQGRAEHAQAIGADGIAFVAPFYYPLESVDALVDYCAEVAGCAPEVPFYYYHIPVLTGCTLSPYEFLERGADRIPSLRGMKFTDRDLGELQRCLAALDGRFDIQFGWDEALLAGFGLGVRGAIGSTYNFAAPLYYQILDAFDRGDLAAARAQQAKSVALGCVLRGHCHYISAAKKAMAMFGIDCGPPRLPLPTLTDADAVRLQSELDRLGLFELLQVA